MFFLFSFCVFVSSVYSNDSAAVSVSLERLPKLSQSRVETKKTPLGSGLQNVFLKAFSQVSLFAMLIAGIGGCLAPFYGEDEAPRRCSPELPLSIPYYCPLRSYSTCHIQPKTRLHIYSSPKSTPRIATLAPANCSIVAWASNRACVQMAIVKVHISYTNNNLLFFFFFGSSSSLLPFSSLRPSFFPPSIVYGWHVSPSDQIVVLGCDHNPDRLHNRRCLSVRYSNKRMLFLSRSPSLSRELCRHAVFAHPFHAWISC